MMVLCETHCVTVDYPKRQERPAVHQRGEKSVCVCVLECYESVVGVIQICNTSVRRVLCSDFLCDGLLIDLASFSYPDQPVFGARVHR
jgi:hypothetical protein